MLLRVLNPTASSTSATPAAAATPMLGAGPQRKSSISSAPSTPSPAVAGGASYPNRSRQKVRVSPLSLPSLRSYIRNDYATAPQNSQVASSGTNFHPAYSSSSGFYHSLLGVTLDDSFLKEFATLGAPESTNSSSAATSSSINSFLVCKESFALTAGTDKKIRFWDLRDPADSYRSDINDTQRTLMHVVSLAHLLVLFLFSVQHLE